MKTVFENIKGVIFDYGGTIDTNSVHWAEVLWAAYVKMEIPVEKQDFRDAYVYGERAMAKNLLVKPTDNFHQVLRIKTHLQINRLVELELLKADKLVLVSNFYGNIETILKDFQLDSFFSSIVESHVVGVRKPDPAIYQLGVDAMGFRPEEIVVIGDSYSKDMVPAKKVGCKAVWLSGPAWGKEEIDPNLPDVTIHSLLEVLDYLL